MRAPFSLGFTLTLAIVVFGCGEDDAPTAGYTHPCDSPMAPTLSCPTQASTAIEGSLLQRACSRLVSCGVLAAEQLVGDNDDHRLDYTWCMTRFSRPGDHNDPCSGRAYSATEVEATSTCILSTSCAGLGTPLGEKGSEAEADIYQCENGDIRRTATICDQGLLSY